MFEANTTLDSALGQLVLEKDFTRRQERAILRALWWPPHRRRLEQRLTALALECGAIPPEGEGLIVDGIYTGSWTEFLDWLIENAPAILDIISAILLFF